MRPCEWTEKICSALNCFVFYIILVVDEAATAGRQNFEPKPMTTVSEEIHVRSYMDGHCVGFVTTEITGYYSGLNLIVREIY